MDAVSPTPYQPSSFDRPNICKNFEALHCVILFTHNTLFLIHEDIVSTPSLRIIKHQISQVKL
jgi:hypothetical protein